MPRYDYRCEECKEAWEEDHTIAERDVPVSLPCPKCGKEGCVEKYLPSTSGLAYSLEPRKVPEAFKDVLRNIKKNHRRSLINV
jgi:putative FmdB family regulatory protein